MSVALSCPTTGTCQRVCPNRPLTHGSVLCLLFPSHSETWAQRDLLKTAQMCPESNRARLEGDPQIHPVPPPPSPSLCRRDAIAGQRGPCPPWSPRAECHRPPPPHGHHVCLPDRRNRSCLLSLTLETATLLPAAGFPNKHD